MKRIICLTVFIFILFSLCSCVDEHKPPYDLNWMLGKTAEEIKERYGNPEPDIDPENDSYTYNYHKQCEHDVDYIVIHFNKNGVADRFKRDEFSD